MKYSILFLLTLLVTSCSTTPKNLDSNNKNVSKIVLSLKNENFKEAKTILNSLDKSSKGVVKYKVFNWEEFNPIRNYKISTMTEYLDKLERYHGSYFSCIQYLNTNASSYEYKSAIKCLTQLKDNAGDEAGRKSLYHKSFISGDYLYNPQSAWTPKWVYKCREKPYYCSMFGKITPDTKSSGAAAFMEYWTGKKLGELTPLLQSKLTQEKNEKTSSDLKEKAYKNSPSFITNQICDYNRNISGFKKGIDKEKRASKYSGVVDSQKMYELGKAILLYESWVKNLKSKYRSKFKRRWTSSCK